MVYLATLPEEYKRAGLKDISVGINSPEAFTGKILQALVKADLLDSAKGPHGGFYLKKNSEAITLASVVQAIDGDMIFNGCALGLTQCSEQYPCAIHHKYKAIRDHLSGMLISTSLQEVASDITTGAAYLKLNNKR